MSSELRERIIDAAIRVLERHGPKGFGQVKVSREAGVAQGHLTYYFPRKSDLAAAVLERITRESREAMMPLVLGAGELPYEARVEAIVGSVRRALSDDARTRVTLALWAEAVEDDALASVIARGLELQRSALAQLLARPEDDASVHLTMAAIRGLALEHLVSRRSAKSLEAVVERLRDLLLKSPRRS